MAFGVPEEKIVGTGRGKAQSRARFAAVMLSRDLLGLGHAEAARVVGRSDHTTSVHAYREARRLMAEDLSFARMTYEAQGFAETIYASEVRALESTAALKVRLRALEEICGVLLDMVDGSMELDLDLLDAVRGILDRNLPPRSRDEAHEKLARIMRTNGKEKENGDQERKIEVRIREGR